MKNVLSRTGQVWKIITMFIVIVLSGASMVYGQLNIDSLSSELFFYYVAGSAIIGLLSFVFACVSIKCPSCGAKWFWSAVNGKGNKEWLFWLSTLETCPDCDNPKHE